MPFLPFGDRFDIASPLPPESVKAAIHKHKKHWLTRKNGARGWIVGPFVCLWWSDLKLYGPMLIGRIHSDGAQTWISGRAGSDLNGVAWFIILGLPLAMIVYLAVASGQASLTWAAAMIAFFVVGLGLKLWTASADRHEAAPLIRFLEKTVIIKVRPPKKPG